MDLEAIKLRCMAATPGPMRVSSSGHHFRLPHGFPYPGVSLWVNLIAREDEVIDGIAHDNLPTVIVGRPVHEDHSHSQSWHDADFYAHARTDLPAVVAHAEELRAVLAPLLDDPVRIVPEPRHDDGTTSECVFCGDTGYANHEPTCPVLDKDRLLGRVKEVV